MNPENQKFVHAVMKSRKRFEALRTFTLESGREEIERLNRRRKEILDGPEPSNSPTRTTRNSSIESIRSPQSSRAPSLSNVPEEGGTFAIGDDDDSDNEDHELQPTPSQSSPSNHNSRSPSVSSSVDDAVPLQLRGMSEKARGKMPAGQSTFSRQNSMTSLSNHSSAVLSTGTGFNPSAQWASLLLSFQFFIS